MSKKVPLDRLRQLSKQRSIRKPQLIDEGALDVPAPMTEHVPREWPILS